ncbi:Pleckstrin homology domain-containing family A member 1 [Psilocybe cubensis]|uniref:Pleckstrin homology domain-containing family A member 1 n=1 Tax=Psilocybe cubensis TaxID=181762 RepID=A0ACB8H0P0_PSICU|nr:Pleckstrin homology domain-containing family A member 1 [Psilocybe cubensis]KAH9481305.1 Pleckstrin homology domain-containing family A member 1 [Psilocybe cubensis]
MSPTAAPPTPQEIIRKLSVHSVSRERVKTASFSGGPVSGTESDSDSILTPDVSTPMGHPQSMHVGPSSTSHPPLSSIAERRSDSGEDSEDEDAAEGPGGWKTADVRTKPRNSADESVIKAGYLWKKGERRKTWKKRWFVLRPAHIAYYKSSAEYQLLRLLELSDVHSCTQVNLKRHENTFGLISPTRTYYLQASTPQDMQSWVKAIEDARETLLATSTRTSAATPIPIPRPTAEMRSSSRGAIPLSSSPNNIITSSDSEDNAGTSIMQGYSAASPTQAAFSLPPSKASVPNKDPGKTVLSGYLMKCGSKRRNWRKRWFVLTGEKLMYSGSHMDTKPHNQFPFSSILDALEYDLHRQHPTNPSVTSPPHGMNHAEGNDEVNSTHTFKIVTTKRTLLLCAPSEDDEIKWLGAIRALIARRMESGQIPGKTSSKSPPVAGHQHHDGSAGAGANAGVPATAPAASGGSVAASAGSGIKAKVRRLSAAGSISLGHHGDHAPHHEMREAKASS